ncbi:MAG: hypothetical protein LUQ38_08405 [Methanotrichaceae archaeon]|nr:hypothetical protein [Methanotrichaceae archaeon]
MDETEALIQRRELLKERISRMEYEIEKIDDRLAFINQITQSYPFHMHECLSQEVSCSSFLSDEST